MSDYDDIIDLPHHVSPTRARMSRADRAAQFSSFEALTGHEEQIEEAARLTDGKLQLSPEETEALNSNMNYIIDNIALCPEVEIIYFVPDERKDGGKYLSVSMKIRKIDLVNRAITDTENNVINIDYIYSVKVKNRPSD
jgi:hypothetical protein